MGGYLDTYGAGEEKRETIVRKVIVWVLIALVTAGVLWFIFHYVIPNRSEQAEVNRFFQLLSARDYRQAYAMFGCTDAKPCRDYSLQAFEEDWGAQALPLTTFQVLDGESCGSGVIVTVDTGKSGDKKLWVERKSGILGSMPPGMERCPKGNRIYDFIRSIRYRLHGRRFEE